MFKLAAFLVLFPFATASYAKPAAEKPAPPPFDVRLTQAEGKVTLVMGGAKGPPIYGDLPLMPGDVIQTGPNSRAEIFFDTESLVRLGPNSALKITRLAAHQCVLTLWYGTLLAKVDFKRKEGDRFSVLTDAAVAFVRGTELAVEHARGRSWFGVLDEGHVAVKAPGFKKEVVMHFNQETLVVKGSPPRDVQVLQRLYPHKDQMAEMRSRIKVLRKRAGQLTLEQRQMMRAGWMKTHTPFERRPPARKALPAPKLEKKKAAQP